VSGERGDHARDAATVFEVLRDFQADGYAGDLFAEEGGQVRCGTCDEVSPAGDLDVAQLRRLEGASDPADMAAVVAAPCPRCGAKGVMVVMYGPEASGADADVLAALRTPSSALERPGTDQA
jgi:hypothetical protein